MRASRKAMFASVLLGLTSNVASAQEVVPAASIPGPAKAPVPVVAASAVASRPKVSKAIGDSKEVDRYGMPIPMIASGFRPISGTTAKVHSLSDNEPSASDTLSGSLIDLGDSNPSAAPAPAPEMPAMPGEGTSPKGIPSNAKSKQLNATDPEVAATSTESDGSQDSEERQPQLVKRGEPIRLSMQDEDTEVLQEENTVAPDESLLNLRPIAPLVIELNTEAESKDAATEFSLSDTSSVEVNPLALNNSRPIKRVPLPSEPSQEPPATPPALAKTTPEKAVAARLADDVGSPAMKETIAPATLARNDIAPEIVQTRFSDTPAKVAVSTANMPEAITNTPVSAVPASLRRVETVVHTQQVAVETQPMSLASAAEQPAAQQPQSSSALSHEGLDVERGSMVELRDDERRTISCDTTILEHSVEHPDICRLVKVGGKELSVIGLKAGQTRIAFVTNDAKTGEKKIVMRQVTIEAKQNLDTQMKMASDLTDTISQMFNTKKVRVVSKGDELVVEGTAATERDARKIISLVRQTALVPVVDRLRSYYK